MSSLPLFMPADLRTFLRKPAITDEQATSAEKVVWGWLQPVLGLEVRPYPVPAKVFSWAIELGAIAHENPAGRTSRQLGPFQEQFSAERRAEILAEAGRGGLTATAPQGSFPEPLDYPDGTW
jgi:hypothetical protein